MQKLKWKNFNLATKLSIGFGTLIAIFFLPGTMALLNMQAIQKKSEHLGVDLIPLAGTAYHLEHFTHEAMHAMLGFALSGEESYYTLAKEHLHRINNYHEQLDSLTRLSPRLNIFIESSQVIRLKIDEFTGLCHETALMNIRIRELQQVMDSTFGRFERYSYGFLIKENQDLREKILDHSTHINELVASHRLSKIANVIIDKGNISRIEIMKAIASKDHQLIMDVYQAQYRFIFSLLEEARKIADARTLRWLNNIENAVEYNKSLLFELSEAIHHSKRLEKKVEEVAFSALLDAHRISSESSRITAKLSSETIYLLDASTRFLILGLLLSFILALVFSFRITRAIVIPLEKSIDFAEKVSTGKLNVDLDVEQKDEAGKLANALKKMLRSLKKSNAARKKAEQQMLNSILETEQRERKRFAEDLHDGIGPLLSTLKLYINSLESQSTDHIRRKKMLENANLVIDEAINSTRRIANNLMPQLVSDFGLKVALESFCQKLGDTNAIEVELDTLGFEERTDQNTETMLFNTILELANNTIRHAQATHIYIGISRLGENLVISYKDNGKGCNIGEILEEQQDHLGLHNIISRINSIDGHITFNSAPSEGFSATIHLVQPTKQPLIHATNN